MPKVKYYTLHRVPVGFGRLIFEVRSIHDGTLLGFAKGWADAPKDWQAFDTKGRLATSQRFASKAEAARFVHEAL
jgi:hypothetical protein